MCRWWLWILTAPPYVNQTVTRDGCVTPPAVTVVRLAEFAGDLMERQSGEYDFSFFDAVMETPKKK